MINKSNVILMLMSVLTLVLAKTCVPYTSSDGNYYYKNLANLTLGPSDAYTTTPFNATRYTFNLCSAVTAFSTTANCNPPQDQNFWSAYQLITGPTNYCNPWGEYNTLRYSDGLNGPASGVTFTYYNSYTDTYAPCKDNNIRKIIIFVACDPNAKTAVISRASSPTTNCIASVNMTSAYACGKRF
eukprot:TRINITY_DN1623_c0_g2_i1.p1 TRINITY_DN1623_c0_g2~~TRINITY_DN1623_c0_g2_i1.p1  ORF type:complete len:185 (+),score=4.41 TRINITY_DN1623_c0_g2_i1:392-946(+)